MTGLLIIFAALTLAAVVLARRQQAREDNIRRLSHEFRRLRRRHTRLHYRNRRRITAAPWERRHTRPENPDARKYEGKWR